MMISFFLLSMAALAAAWRLVDSEESISGDGEQWGTPWLMGLTRFFLLWIGVGWSLAALRQLRPAGLMGAAVVMALLAASIFLKHGRAMMALLSKGKAGLLALRFEWVFLGTLALLLAFSLFRGWILPCANSDALAWSMPIAIRYHLAHGLDWSTPPQAEWLPHLSDPHNYELIVASILSLIGKDRVTEWFSSFVACGILSVVGVQFRRWQGPGLQVWATLLVFAAAPVFLLHFSSDKGDLLTTLLILLGIFWVVRVWLEEGTNSDVLALWVLFALFNVKRSGWMLAPLLILAVYLRMAILAARARNWTPTILRIAGHSLAAALAMGGVKTVWLWHHTQPVLKGVIGVATHLSPSTHHFSWADPFRFLWVVSLAPFRSTDYTVRLLSGVEWYWPEYNLIYSHFGWAFGPALLIATVVLLAGLFGWGPARRFSREQGLYLGASAVLAYLLLAHNYAYDGGFNTFPRFVLFALGPILAAGLLPLTLRARRPLMVGTATVLMLGGASLEAYKHDMVAPFIYLEDLWRHPSKRRWVFVGPNRMPCILDRLAGARATVVADCTYLTWLAPLWGEGFTRDVRLLEWKNGQPRIPIEAEWVVIDNVSGLMWGNGRDVRNAEDFANAFRRGVPTERDTRLFPILQANPEWERVMASPLGEQAIFKRKASIHLRVASGA